MAARTLPNLALQAFFIPGEDEWNDEVDLNFLKLSVLTQAGAASKVSATPGSPTDGDVHIFSETHPTNANAIAVYDVDTWKYFTPVEGWLVYNRALNYFELFDGTAWAEFETGGGSGGGAVAVDDEGTEILEAALRMNFAGDGVTVTDGADGIAVITIPGGSSLSPVVTVAGTSDNLDPTDSGAYQRWTGGSAKTLTVQPESTTAQPANAEWHIRNVGSSDLTIVAGSGVTITPPAGGTLVVPTGGTVTLKRVAEDTYDLMGLVVAA